MDNLILYHGSDKIIEKPLFYAGKINNDYGQGFYCTKHIELAKEWAVDNERSGFVNSYELNTKGLKFLDLNSSDYSILHWLTVLLEHRDVRINTPVAQDGLEFLKRNYHLDIEGYDYIVGYRADDSYFSFARAFISNSISISQLEKAMYLGDLGKQYFLQSEKAFSKLKFVEAMPVDYDDYYPKKMARDQEAVVEKSSAIMKTLSSGDILIPTLGQILPGVIYGAPVINEYLMDLQTKLYDALKDVYGLSFSKYYQPYSWMPHITLGKTLDSEQMRDAFSYLQKSFVPLEARVEEIGIAKTNPHRDVVRISVCGE